MRFFLLAVVGGIFLSVTSLSAKQLGNFQNWSASVEGKGQSRACWIYSEPVKHVGKYKRRGRIYALVTHVPGKGVTNQVQLTAGYTFKKGSTVQVAIGKHKFQLFTNTDTAWAQDKKEDAALVRAMRSGSRMIVNGVSSRGTKTRDTYSLSGISAAHRTIGKACKVK